VLEKPDVPTTSGKPRYVLTKDFAELFQPSLTDTEFREKVERWQSANLSTKALARIVLVRGGAAASEGKQLVTLPNGEVRRLTAGPSAMITKAVIEMFTSQFLREPAVLFISESGNKVVARDDELARKIRMNIRPEKNLPDIILVDLAILRLIFIEVVATDGPINARRKSALAALAKEAGFGTEDVAFVTAYADRGGTAFRKTVSDLAWGSYAWFASEPKCLIELSENRSSL
jgi:transcription termination factor NusB